MAQAHEYDAIVLDVMLPASTASRPAGGCATSGVWAPVLMLTARDAVEDRVAGLDTRRRRLPRQAVRVRRAARAPARARPPRRRRAADACSRSATCGSTRRRREVRRGGTEIELSAKEFALLETFMRRPGEVLVALRPARARLGLRLREPLERRRRLRPLAAARRSTSRSAGARSRRCAARATGCGRTAARDARADPAPGGGGLRARDGARARRHGLVPLRPARLAPRHARSTASFGCARRTSRRSSGSPARSLAAAAAAASSSAARATRSSLDARGHVLDATPPLGAARCSTAAELRARAARRRSSPTARRVPGLDEPSRLLATPVGATGRRLVLVVGATREDRAEALASLRDELLIAGPIALILAIARRLPARRALRCGRSRRCAAAPPRSPPTDPGERLPVPPTATSSSARRDAQRDARAARGRARARARASSPTRPRAADAARAPAHRARAGAPARRVAGRAARGGRAARREEVDRLAQLAEDLLLIARSDAAAAAPRRGARRGRAARARCASGSSGAPRRRDARSSARGSGVAVHGDRLRLEQALGNLVDNALRHGAGTFASRRARRRRGRAPRHRRGRRLPADFLEHAFERFTRGRRRPRRARGAASGSRSCGRSPRRTAGKRRPRTAVRVELTSGSCYPPGDTGKQRRAQASPSAGERPFKPSPMTRACACASRFHRPFIQGSHLSCNPSERDRR